MEGRSRDERVARADHTGTTWIRSRNRPLVRHSSNQPAARVHYKQRVTALVRENGGRWRLRSTISRAAEKAIGKTKFVFIGEAGARCTLPAEAGIPKATAYGGGGFPVSGELWLRLRRSRETNRHHAKVTARRGRLRPRCRPNSTPCIGGSPRGCRSLWRAFEPNF